MRAHTIAILHCVAYALHVKWNVLCTITFTDWVTDWLAGWLKWNIMTMKLEWIKLIIYPSTECVPFAMIRWKEQNAWEKRRIFLSLLFFPWNAFFTLCDCRAYISLYIELTMLACMPCRMSPFQNVCTHYTHCVHLEWQSAIKKWMRTRNRRLSTLNSVLRLLVLLQLLLLVLFQCIYLNRYKLSSSLCANEQDKLTQIQTITSYVYVLCSSSSTTTNQHHCWCENMRTSVCDAYQIRIRFWHINSVTLI